VRKKEERKRERDKGDGEKNVSPEVPHGTIEACPNINEKVL
jgi:hypothetical protein